MDWHPSGPVKAVSCLPWLTAVDTCAHNLAMCTGVLLVTANVFRMAGCWNQMTVSFTQYWWSNPMLCRECVLMGTVNDTGLPSCT